MNAEALCGKVARFITRDAPAGIGQWEQTWKIVHEPSRRFIEALDAGDEMAARREGNATVLAWRRAAAEWRVAGCP